LTSTVVPSNATNQTIAWSVVSGSATVSGSTLNATAAGTVTVRATITDGTAQGTNYTQNFNITASGGTPATDYTGTYSGGLSYLGDYDLSDITFSGTTISGSTVTISNVTLSSDNNLTLAGVKVGTWAYVYSGGTKIGVTIVISSGVGVSVSDLVLGKAQVDIFKSSWASYGFNVETSDMTDDYAGTLMKL